MTSLFLRWCSDPCSTYQYCYLFKPNANLVYQMYIEFFYPKTGRAWRGFFVSNLNSPEKGLIPRKLTTKLHPEEIDDWKITIPLDITSFFGANSLLVIASWEGNVPCIAAFWSPFPSQTMLMFREVLLPWLKQTACCREKTWPIACYFLHF